MLMRRRARLTRRERVRAHGRRIDLRAAWAMTKGRFWPLLGAYALAFALSVVVVILTFAISVAVVGIVGGGLGAIGTTLQAMATSVATMPTTPARSPRARHRAAATLPPFLRERDPAPAEVSAPV